jgi:hypothetical protein
MRRITIFFLFALTFLATAVAGWAQEKPTTAPIPVANPPEQMLTGTSSWQQNPLETVDSPLAVTAPGNTCGAATAISLPYGETANVYSYTAGGTDPVLSCRWGGPSIGSRTAWYKFTAPYNGRVVIDTFGSSYDTILALYEDISPDTIFDPCIDFANNMRVLSCQDDTVEFTSRLSASVKKDAIYYIEVADWTSSGTDKSLQISVLMEPIATFWTQETPMPLARSRHATAVAGNNIYVVGGQTNLGAPTLTSRFERYETNTDQWVTLPNMPVESADAGYANTTAAYVNGPSDNGRIYLPSGFDGSYNMTHWAYDIQGSYWLTRTAVTDSFPATVPFAWATAVAVTSPDPGYYLIGGLSSIGTPSSAADVRDDMLFFSPVSNTTFPYGVWLNKSRMGTPRYAHTAALVNGKICVAGGLRYDAVDGLILLTNGECYTPGTGIWGNIADMNYPRYEAGSAVGPDGKWYVFGGIDGAGNAISETEVYDPIANTWTVLDVNRDLGATASLPARAWPRGGVVGSRLYAIGGHNMPAQQPLSLVESIFISTRERFLPIIFSSYGRNTRPDDNFSVAHLMALNIAQSRNFDTSQDYFDVYYFDLAGLTAVTVNLTQVPSDSNYDIAVYDANKVLRGQGVNLQGISESVPLTLSAGRYYVVVERVFPIGDPNTANYRLVVNK